MVVILKQRYKITERYFPFHSRQEAENAYNSDYKEYIGLGINQKGIIGEQIEWVDDPIVESIKVLTFYNPIRDSIKYRGISVEFGNVLFSYARLDNATVNIASFLGVVHALAYNLLNNLNLPVYSDNTCAIKWVKKKAINTSLERSVSTEHIFNLIDRAVAWLNTHAFACEILKWQTKVWE